jgi:hypothetical protein
MAMTNKLHGGGEGAALGGGGEEEKGGEELHGCFCYSSDYFRLMKQYYIHEGDDDDWSFFNFKECVACRMICCSAFPMMPAAPTRHFVVLRRVWFLLIKYIFFKAYPLLTPKCRVGADGMPADIMSSDLRDLSGSGSAPTRHLGANKGYASKHTKHVYFI